MAETFGSAQAALAATTLTDVYTCPGGKKAVVNVTIVNRGGTATTFRLAKAIAGAADATKQYYYYDEPLPANRSFEVTKGIVLNATDVIRAFAGNGNVSVNVDTIES